MKGDATTATNIHTEITTPDTESYEGCSSSISTLSAMEKERYNATVIPPSEQHRFNIPTPLRNQTRPIQRLELPVTFTDSSTNETTTGPDKP